MKKFDLKRLAAIIYALAITAMAFLFFTNDFGLVDIRKTAVIIGAGIDLTEGGVSVTAQVAVPQPSENGENTVYIEVEGEGATVADALNVINKKTGFFPKLVFCKLLILGESCRNADIFEVLDYFYRDDYTQLTPVIAMCSGSAGELLASKMRFGNTATVSIERLLSDEAKKSANVSTVNLKMIGIDNFSQSAACYMPYIRARAQSLCDLRADLNFVFTQRQRQDLLVRVDRNIACALDPRFDHAVDGIVSRAAYADHLDSCHTGQTIQTVEHGF